MNDNLFITMDQPNLICSKGHLIPANAEMDIEGNAHPVVIGGHYLTNSQLVCEVCARAAGGTVERSMPRAKGLDLENLGQETIFTFDLPVLEID